MSRTLRISRDLKLLEKYCNTTADKIRAKIQRQRERLKNMTGTQKDKMRGNRLREARERELFQEAKKAEPGLTYHQHQADLLLAQFNKNNPTPSEFKEEPSGALETTDGESKATSGGRKTRKKSGGNGDDPLPVWSRVRLLSDWRNFTTGMTGRILEVENRDGRLLYKVQFDEPAGWDRVIGLTKMVPADKFAVVEEEEKDAWSSSDEEDDDVAPPPPRRRCPRSRKRIASCLNPSRTQGGQRKTRRKRRRKRKKRGGYGPGITAEEARQMRIREERRREAERQQEIREAEAAATRARELREQREADIIRRANELMPNRDITDLSEAEGIVEDHERHESLMYDLIPVAVDLSGGVPLAIEAKQSLWSYLPWRSIPTAEVVDEGKIPMATEVERVRVGGRKTKRRRKKHKKTRRR